jgi:hypothetical protein
MPEPHMAEQKSICDTSKKTNQTPWKECPSLLFAEQAAN